MTQPQPGNGEVFGSDKAAARLHILQGVELTLATHAAENSDWFNPTALADASTTSYTPPLDEPYIVPSGVAADKHSTETPAHSVESVSSHAGPIDKSDPETDESDKSHFRFTEIRRGLRRINPIMGAALAVVLGATLTLVPYVTESPTSTPTDEAPTADTDQPIDPTTTGNTLQPLQSPEAAADVASDLPTEAATTALVSDLRLIAYQDPTPITHITPQFYETVQEEYNDEQLSYVEAPPEVKDLAAQAFDHGIVSQLLHDKLFGISTNTKNDLLNAAVFIDDAEVAALYKNIVGLYWLMGIDQYTDWSKLDSVEFQSYINKLDSEIAEQDDPDLAALGASLIDNLIYRRIVSQIEDGSLPRQGTTVDQFIESIQELTARMDDSQEGQLEELLIGQTTDNKMASSTATGKIYGDQEAMGRLLETYRREHRSLRDEFNENLNAYLTDNSRLANLTVETELAPFETASDLPIHIGDIKDSSANTITIEDAFDERRVTQVGSVFGTDYGFRYAPLEGSLDDPEQIEAWDTLLRNLAPLIEAAKIKVGLNGIAVVATEPDPATPNVLIHASYISNGDVLVLPIGSIENPTSFASAQYALTLRLLVLILPRLSDEATTYDTQDSLLQLCRASEALISGHVTAALQQNAAQLESAQQEFAPTLPELAQQIFSLVWNSGGLKNKNHLYDLLCDTPFIEATTVSDVAVDRLASDIQTGAYPNIDEHAIVDAVTQAQEFPDYWLSLTGAIDDELQTHGLATIADASAKSSAGKALPTLRYPTQQQSFERAMLLLAAAALTDPVSVRDSIAASPDRQQRALATLTLALMFRQIADQHADMTPFLDNRLSIALNTSGYHIDSMTPDDMRDLDIALTTLAQDKVPSDFNLMILPPMWALALRDLSGIPAPPLPSNSSSQSSGPTSSGMYNLEPATP